MFEVYRPRARKDAKEKDPAIKISKQSIVLDKNARGLLNADSIELAYDRDNNIIRLAKTDNDQGITLKKTKLFAKGFLIHFEIEAKGKFAANYNQEQHALFAKL